MPAIVYLGAIVSKPPLNATEGSLVVRWLSLVSCLQLCAFLTGILAWIMCVASAASVDWRQWRVENVSGTGSGIISVGIWTVCFWKDPNDGGSLYWHCEELNEQHPTLPREIFIAQDLMALAAIATSMALAFMSFALYNVFKPVKHKDFVIIFFGFGATLNFSAGILVFISVIWNMYVVLENRGINFPVTFGLPRIPSEQRIGAAIYVGYIAAGLLLLSASIAFVERFCFRPIETRRIETVVIHTPGSAVKSESQTTCPKCGSVVDLVIKDEPYPAEVPGSREETPRSSPERSETPSLFARITEIPQSPTDHTKTPSLDARSTEIPPSPTEPTKTPERSSSPVAVPEHSIIYVTPFK